MVKQKKKDQWGYDVDNPFDREMVLDLPFESLNKAGRKAKRKKLMKID